jgi:hypothetical protein
MPKSQQVVQEYSFNYLLLPAFGGHNYLIRTDSSAVEEMPPAN